MVSRSGAGWVGSVGGFYRTSDGVRDPQFKADEGGQFTGTLSRDFDTGNVMFFARYLNDKNQFITPIPLIQSGTDHFSAYPGFDPLKDTYNSKALQHVSLPSYPGGTNADLADGRGAEFSFFGANLDWEFADGWTTREPACSSTLATRTRTRCSHRAIPRRLPKSCSRCRPISGGYALPAGAVATSNLVGGGAVDPNQSVIKQGWWHIHKRLFNLNNDVRVSKKIFEGNTLTLGAYVAYYTMDDKWSLGNTMLMTQYAERAAHHGELRAGGQTFQLTDPQGFLDLRRLQHRRSVATQATRRSTFPTRGASTNG